MDNTGMEWTSLPNNKGITIELDPDDCGVFFMSIVPIDDIEQKIIDKYDTKRFQSPDDTLVWYVCWPDGEWQPRQTGGDYDAMRQDAERWLYEYMDS